MYSLIRDYEKGLEDLTKALELDPNNETFNTLLAIVQKRQPTSVINIEDLALEFNSNAVVAHDKYINRKMSVQGKVNRVDYAIQSSFYKGSRPYVRITSSYFWVECYFGSATKEVTDLRKNDDIILQGIFEERSSSTLTLVDCSIKK